MPGPLECETTADRLSTETKKKKESNLGASATSGEAPQRCSGCLTTVVGLGDGIKLLLPGGVPQHQPHLLAVYTATEAQERSSVTNILYHNIWSCSCISYSLTG